MNKYQLINIDTSEVTMCEKITIEGNDYFVNNNVVYFVNGAFFLTKENIIHTIYGYNYGDKVIIATTNTSLQCPKVVDYVKELAKSRFFYEYFKKTCVTDRNRDAFIEGYQKHSKTHSLSDEEAIQFVGYCINKISMSDYIHTSKTDLLQQFKSTLPTKVYYR